jgi:hypothetical protein
MMQISPARLGSDSSAGLGAPRHAGHPRAVRVVVLLACSLICLAACGGPQRARPTTGAIAGLARDRDSGDPIAKAEIRVHGGAIAAQLVTASSDRGLYDVDHLPPGRYRLSSSFAGQEVEVVNIDVRAGEVTVVDLVFTLGRPEPIRVDFGDASASAIDRYRPRGLAGAAVIEGTVNDTTTRMRVPGAVVTAVGRGTWTQQTVSDDHGRFRFDALPPGVYSVSAYYSIGGRGQIEVRRSGIHAAAAEAVIVPLWIETAR